MTRSGYQGPGFYRDHQGRQFSVLFLAKDHTGEQIDAVVFFEGSTGTFHCTPHSMPPMYGVRIAHARNATDYRRKGNHDCVVYLPHDGTGLTVRQRYEFDSYVEMDVPRFQWAASFQGAVLSNVVEEPAPPVLPSAPTESDHDRKAILAYLHNKRAALAITQRQCQLKNMVGEEAIAMISIAQLDTIITTIQEVRYLP